MGQAIDLTGQKFGMLTVLERAETSKDGKAMWKCRCDCGVEKDVSGKLLRNGNTRSCGCNRFKKGRRVERDLVGMKFGWWTVLEYAGIPDGKHPEWKCVCKCGKVKNVDEINLLKGATTSCNCRKSVIEDGFAKHHMSIKKENSSKKQPEKIYGVWCSIKQRCNNQNNQGYQNYGGRGIKICEEWDTDFIKFYEWSIENGYKDGLTIDRIDNDQGYSPENCRWVDWHTQMLNRRNTLRFTINGVSKTMYEWADEYEIPQRIVYNRLCKGWTIDRALSTPYVPSKNQRNYHYKCQI